MTSLPNFIDGEFVNAALLNISFGNVGKSLAAIGRNSFAAPGLLYPELNSAFGATGLVVGVTFSPSFGLVTSGAVAYAHGNTANADTQTYSVNMASLVPASGAVTAYLLLAATTVQQQSTGVPGPATGHPSYNPNFVPTTVYQAITDTLALTASTSAPDNVSTFELARTTLSAGQGSIAVSGLTTAFQQRATAYDASPGIAVTGSYAISPATGNAVFTCSTAGLTTTVPDAQTVVGQVFRFVNASSGVWTIATAVGAQNFIGLPSGTANSFQIPASGAVTVWGGNGFFSIMSADAITLSVAEAYARGTVSATIPGYMILPNGFILQYGKLSVGPGSPGVLLGTALPYTFPTGPLTSWCSVGDANVYTSSQVAAASVYGLSASTFNFTWVSSAGSTSFNWFVLGR